MPKRVNSPASKQIFHYVILIAIHLMKSISSAQERVNSPASKQIFHQKESERKNYHLALKIFKKSFLKMKLLRKLIPLTLFMIH